MRAYSTQYEECVRSHSFSLIGLLERPFLALWGDDIKYNRLYVSDKIRPFSFPSKGELCRSSLDFRYILTIHSTLSNTVIVYVKTTLYSYR